MAPFKNALGFPLRHALALALVALAGVACYVNALDAPFTFDDRMYVTENPTIKDLGYFLDTSKADALHMEGIAKRYLRTRYVAYLSFWADYKLYGLDERGFHITNLTIHLSSAFALYALVLMTLRAPRLSGSALAGRAWPVALFSALIFVSHPIQTEAVTYISQRFASLAGMFYLSSLAAYARSRLSRRLWEKRTFYVLSLFYALLAMKTKESAFTLPFALALYEAMFFDGPMKKRLALLVPFLLVSLVIPVEYVREGMRAGDVGAMTRLQSDMPRHEYLFTQMRVVATYIRLLFLPVNQNFDYDYPLSARFTDPGVALSFALLAAFGGLAVACLRASKARPGLRLVSFGIAWFFLALSVESSVIPISEIITEYRVYLPSSFAIVGVVSAVFLFASEGRRFKRAALATLVTAFLLFSALAYARNALWADNAGLFEDTVKKSPLKARARVNLGVAYDRKERLAEAEQQYLAALSLAPNDITASMAHNNLGTIYEKRGLYDEAKKSHLTAIILQPDNARLYSNLGIVYEKQGLVEKARAQYLKALGIDPSDAAARYNLARLAAESEGKLGEAEQLYRAALDSDPDLAEAHYGLGLAHEKQGRAEEAMEEYRAALKINPAFAEAHYNLGVIYHGKGLAEEAEEEYRAAIRSKPGYARAYNNLGVLLAGQGRYRDAYEQFQRAAELEPEDDEIRRNLEQARLKAQ